MNDRRVCSSLFFLFLLGLCAPSACDSGGEDVEVVREINACWNAANDRILLVESHYLTPDPQEPYYDATQGHDWSIVLYRTDVDLSNREEILRWDEEAEPGGGLEYSLIYWFWNEKRFVGMEYNIPWLTNLETGERTLLVPPDDVLFELFGDLMEGAAVQDVTPAAGGEVIGVFITVAYLPDPDDPFDLHFLHAMSFFDPADGRHVGSVRIPFANDRVDPHLTPAEPVVRDRYHFLWKPDASAVYVLYRQEAFMVSAVDLSVAWAPQVPDRAYPTSGGAVADDGTILVTEIDGNEATIVEEGVEGWIPFAEIPLIPQGREDYTVDMR